MPGLIDDETTIGIEVEFTQIPQQGFDGFDSGIKFTPHNDGSTRGPTFVLQGTNIPIILQRDQNNFIMCSGIQQQREYGMELVSDVHTLGHVKRNINKFVRHVRHINKDPKTSIHLHVDIADRPWTYTKNVILWARHLEAILYRLAAGGDEHRGSENNYKFCRPLSNPIGAYAGVAMKAIPLIDWKRFVQSTSLSEMLSAWGRLDWHCAVDNLPHYIGHRLHSVNLISAVRQGTLEWRVFDALYGNLALFIAVVEGIHKLGASGPPDDRIQAYDLGDNADIECDQISELLGVDVAPIWGYKWQPKPKSDWPEPHYGAVRLPKDPLCMYKYDDGSDTCVIYRR